MDLFGFSYAILWIVVLVEAVAVVFLLRAVGGIYLGTRDAIERDGIPIGATAPAVDARDAEGHPLQVFDNTAWHFLIFSVPTCQICRRLLPDLMAVQRRLEGVVRFVVMLQATPPVAAEFAKLTGFAGPVAAIDRNTAKAFRVRVSPFVHVVDAGGRVRAKGLVNSADNAEHLLVAAGVRHRSLASHEEAHQVA